MLNRLSHPNRTRNITRSHVTWGLCVPGLRVGVGNVFCRLSDMRDTWWGTEFTFESLTVTVRTIMFNIQQFHLLSAVFCKFQNSDLCPIQHVIGCQRAFSELRKATISFMSVFPSTWNNSAAKGRIFMRFDIWVFFDSMSRKFKFC
jgi:hypothetical protein